MAGPTASSRAGTCLCHGVPASQSRSSLEVSSFGATPVTTGPAVLAGVVEAEPVRQRDVAGLHASSTSTDGDRRAPLGRRPARGRRRRGRAPRRRPALTRSAPAPSRLRQAGSRKIVLAVNDRRSPADSTNGNSGSRPGGASVGEPVELGQQLGHGEVHLAVVGAQPRPGVLRLVDREHEPDGLARIASNSALAGLEALAEAGPAHRLGVGLRAPVARRPTARAAAAAPSGSVGPSVRYSTPARAGRAPAARRRPRRTRRRTRPGPAAAAARSGARSSSVTARRGPRTGGRGSPARAACPAAGRAAGGGGGRRSPGSRS